MANIFKILLNVFDYFTQKKVIKKIEFSLGKSFSTLIDVGSHHGEYILSLKKKFNIENIYGFEPNPTSFEILKKNLININKIKIYNYGIADIEEDKILNQNIESSSSSINLLNKNSNYYKKKYFLFNFLNLKNVSNSIKIKAINLESFIEEKKN